MGQAAGAHKIDNLESRNDIDLCNTKPKEVISGRICETSILKLLTVSPNPVKNQSEDN